MVIVVPVCELLRSHELILTVDNWLATITSYTTTDVTHSKLLSGCVYGYSETSLKGHTELRNSSLYRKSSVFALQECIFTS